MRSATLFVGVLAAGLLAAAVASAGALADSYRAVDLGTYPGDVSSAATGVNNRARVIGVSTPAGGGQRGFLWRHGHMRDLGRLPAPFDTATRPAAINDRQVIAGDGVGADGGTHGFRWRRGHMTDLGTLGGPSTHAAAINARGDIVGWSNTATVVRYHHDIPVYAVHGFLWRDGTMIDLGDATEADTQALDINDRGTVAGITTRSGTQQAALWRAGAWTILPTPTAGDQGAALALNDRGQAVGSDDVLRAPMLWTASSFADLSATGRCPVLPLYDINDAGWILGAGPDPAHATPFGGVWHGPAVCARGAVIRLPALTPDTGDNWPVRMNDWGAVAGFANMNDGAGTDRAVLWLPAG